VSVTRALIVINVAVFGAQLAYGDAIVAPLALWPVGEFHVPEVRGAVGFHPWQLVTSGFLHASPAHLLLNMFALHMFGRDVERALGSGRFLALYAAAILSAAVLQLAVVSATAEPHATVGASGGVFGILLAFATLYPHRIVVLIFPPIPMPAWLFVTLYGVVELVSGVLGTQAGVAHFAHLGGMLGAYLLLRRWRRHAGRERAWG
jgi:membrane associated rhomboid family serine protease